MSVIERSILATDLAQHFKILPDISDLAGRCRSTLKQADLGSPRDRFTLQALMMTGADLGAVTKPWKVITWGENFLICSVRVPAVCRIVSRFTST